MSWMGGEAKLLPSRRSHRQPQVIWSRHSTKPESAVTLTASAASIASRMGRRTTSPSPNSAPCRSCRSATPSPGRSAAPSYRMWHKHPHSSSSTRYSQRVPHPTPTQLTVRTSPKKSAFFHHTNDWEAALTLPHAACGARISAQNLHPDPGCRLQRRRARRISIEVGIQKTVG